MPVPALRPLYQALLFDVDGVLLDTAGYFPQVWARWAASRDLDPAWVVLHTHGRRTSDVLREVAPHLHPAAEHAALDALAEAGMARIAASAQAGTLLRGLADIPWAIVTSGSRSFVGRCFARTGLPLPAVQVYAEDVRRGKPSPEGYLSAARRLGVPPADCVVVEDAPQGVAAGKAAGCAVVAVAGTHDAAALRAADVCRPSLAHAADLLRALVGLEPQTAGARPVRSIEVERHER
ncbi:MAG TPA: HAD-IA family hydrolase [Pilimelia sp.]|nr:HAD-IA family hydrolase [Pilimelia sp.]